MFAEWLLKIEVSIRGMDGDEEERVFWKKRLPSNLQRPTFFLPYLPMYYTENPQKKKSVSEGKK